MKLRNGKAVGESVHDGTLESQMDNSSTYAELGSPHRTDSFPTANSAVAQGFEQTAEAAAPGPSNLPSGDFTLYPQLPYNFNDDAADHPQVASTPPSLPLMKLDTSSRAYVSPVNQSYPRISSATAMETLSRTPPWSPVASSSRVSDTSTWGTHPPDRYYLDKIEEELEEIVLQRSNEDVGDGAKNQKRVRSGGSRSPKRQKIESKSARRGGGVVGRDPYRHDKEHESDLGPSKRSLEIATRGTLTISATTLIPLILAESSDESFFPLHLADDKNILDIWHGSVLPNLKSDGYEGLIAAHIFRFGLTEENSIPTVLVSLEDSSREDVLRKKISELFEEPMRSSLRISFEESSIRRTVKDQDPPICIARNTSFQEFPVHGASVGIKHRIDSTATLGGYVLIDGHPAVLTVDHLIPIDLQAYYLTHPNIISKDHWPPSASTSSLYMSIEMPPDQSCRSTKAFRQAKIDLFTGYPAHTFGAMLVRSGTRSRPSLERGGEHETEMDWALFEINQWPHSLESHINNTSSTFHFSNVVPGASVRATGRTSGTQIGQINTAMSFINHGTHSTKEWTVFKDVQSSTKDWIEGGIGVDGDSGAWIIDRDTSAIYGMVWGRHRASTRPICLFSPIKDIVEDIKEKLEVSTVCLPKSGDHWTIRGECMQKEGFPCASPAQPVTPRRGGEKTSQTELTMTPPPKDGKRKRKSHLDLNSNKFDGNLQGP